MRHATISTLAFLILAAGIRDASAEDPPTLRIEIQDKNPWTKLDMGNVPQEFQFAVVSLQSGETHREALTTTINSVQLLKPSFVLSVGDLSEGLSDDPQNWDAECSAIEQSLAPLEMPFFLCTGHHAKAAEMDAAWKEKFGRSYYSFRLHDVLFLVLDTDDIPLEGKPYTIGTAQQKWAIEEIDRHADVRWTFIVMHHPIWTYDKKENDPAMLGWQSIEDSLVGRQFTVFAGHLHEHSQKAVDGRNHIVVGKRPEGEKADSQLDNVVVVKMTADGPVIDGQSK